MNTLSSGTQWMLDAGYTPQQLLAYQYPQPEAFVQAGLQIVYLGWFLGDWSLVNNAAYALCRRAWRSAPTACRPPATSTA